ncbi:acyl carrier protein [Streptomyces sp. CAI-85]|uniref:acyl carrier protein n=1 Tax=Streptomyces sp. CAI-85 TaxID=1472662 RepID=UPI001587922C|nr:acyl carrier protein [Streptomyces sp. CAI-85]NUV64338.1 acyl carrier protein [Streptomyces sp. CAI-85]
MTAFPAHAQHLDCLQANLALLADRHHGTGTHTRLGAVPHHPPRPLDDGPLAGLLTVEPTLDQQLADAAALLGLDVTDRRRSGPGEVPDTAGGPLYVVADAYHLPWVPYHGTKHVEHSFLVDDDGGGDTLLISDGYHNDTQWGRARPARLPYGREEFATLLKALPDGAETVRFTPRPLGAPPEPGHVPAPPPEYLPGYAEHPDRRAALEAFTLETWLLARARRLHAVYREERRGAGLPEPVREHLQRWDALVEHAYLAFRRVDRGRAEPPGLFERAAEALAQDAVAFGAGAAVREVVASVLQIDEAALGDRDLTVHPEFNSIRMVEVVEILEDRFAVEFDPADLVPENLQSVAGLCALLHRALDHE